MFPKKIWILAFCAIAVSIPTIGFAQLETGWKANDLSRPAPTVVTPNEEVASWKPPADAIVLFDGTDFEHWTGGVDKWKIVDGAMESGPKTGPAITKEKFGDCQLHVEWATPSKIKGSGQQRGNSGVFLMGAFEIQILDGWENETVADCSAGSVYGQYPPLVNACRKPGEWQTYDIFFRAPKFDADGNLTRRARVTVIHNGLLIQDAVAILGATSFIKPGNYVRGKTEGPIILQDRANPVRFRNVWVRRLAAERPLPAQPYPVADVRLTKEQKNRLVGSYRSEQQETFHIRRKGDQLFCQLYAVKMNMVPLSESEFAFEKCAGKIVFNFNESGEAVQATLKLDAAGERVDKKKPKRPNQPKKKTKQP